MTRPLLLPILGALAASAALAQGPLHYVDGSGNVKVTTSKFKIAQATPTLTQLRFVGGVQLQSISQGLELFADDVSADLVKGATKKNELKKGIAIGSVRMTKTVATPGGKQVTQIGGSRADLTTGAESDQVTIAGPVSLLSINPDQRRTMRATGSRGAAILEPQAKTKMNNGLRSAILDGNVNVDILQTPQNKSETHIHATADRMTVNYVGDAPVLKLIGHVTMKSTGANSLGMINGTFSNATFHLTKAGEVQSMEAN